MKQPSKKKPTSSVKTIKIRLLTGRTPKGFVCYEDGSDYDLSVVLQANLTDLVYLKESRGYVNKIATIVPKYYEDALYLSYQVSFPGVPPKQLEAVVRAAKRSEKYRKVLAEQSKRCGDRVKFTPGEGNVVWKALVKAANA